MIVGSIDQHRVIEVRLTNPEEFKSSNKVEDVPTFWMRQLIITTEKGELTIDLYGDTRESIQIAN